MENSLIEKLKRKIHNYRYQKFCDDFRKSLGSCGKGLYINPNYYRTIKIFNPSHVYIGDYCNINHNAQLIAGKGEIVIGNYVTLSGGSIVLATGYDIEKFFKNEKTHIKLKTVIGDNTWICANAIICPGVKITGKHVVIGAGAVVTKDITESDVLVAGNPAKIVKRY